MRSNQLSYPAIIFSGCKGKQKIETNKKNRLFYVHFIENY